jgi:hypothetical protein
VRRSTTLRLRARSPHALFCFEVRVAELATEGIVARHDLEVFFEAEGVKNIRNSTDGDARLASLDGSERDSRHPGALGNELRRETPALPRQTDIRAELTENTADGRKWRCGLSRHYGYNYIH